MKPVGFVRLNAGEDAVPPDATIIVSGPPRGGTSFVAATLHAANLCMGEYVDPAVLEDPEMNAALAKQARLSREIDWPSLRHLDSTALLRLVAARNATFARWGWKRPNVPAPLVARSGVAIFRSPRLVMVFRDPVALAARIAVAEGIGMTAAIGFARRDNNQNIAAARGAQMPVLLVGYEKALAAGDAFLAELFSFCGLSVDPVAYPRIKATVASAGETYLRLAAAPIVGYINRYCDGVLIGWCRVGGHNRPDSVDIYADGVLVATALADEFRPSLRRAGVGRGYHGFSVRLDHLNLPDTCRLRARASGADTDIANSGRTLADLRMGTAAGP